jgi:hypothetical protein
VPLAVKVKYAVVFEVIAVQLEALGVMSTVALKYAPAISTALPAAMRLALDRVKSVRLIP